MRFTPRRLLTFQYSAPRTPISRRFSTNAKTSSPEWWRTKSLAAGISATLAATAIATSFSTSNVIAHQEPSDNIYVPPSTETSMTIFCGQAGSTLANEVASHLGTQLGRAVVSRFQDGEVQIQILDNVRGKEVYVVQPLAPPVNESLMELVLMVTTLRRASANKITAVIPYFGYTRPATSRGAKDEGGSTPIAAADVATMLTVAGVDQVIVIDLHHTQINGFFTGRTVVDDLDVAGIGASYFSKKALRSPVVVAPGHDAVGRAKRFRDELVRYGYRNAGLAVVVDQRKKLANQPSKKEGVEDADLELERNFELVGDVRGRDCIIRDDIVETGARISNAAKRLKKAGAARVYCYVTHPLLTKEALSRLHEAPIAEVVTTNSVHLKNSDELIRQLSVAKLLAEAIRRIHENESVSAMFNGSGTTRGKQEVANAGGGVNIRQGAIDVASR